MTKKTISIKNWDEFQHYSKRNPPWIKFYHSLLDDYSYGCLHDDSKLLLISLYLLASKTSNKIPHDFNWIQSKAMINKKIKLQPLIDSGFIYVNGFDSEEIVDYKRDDSLRREEKRREETEKRQRKFVAPSMNDVIQFFSENGYSKKSATFAYKYYTDANWHDSRGKPVLNWKQKMRGVWFKEENKEQVYVPVSDTPTPEYLKELVSGIGKKINNQK